MKKKYNFLDYVSQQLSILKKDKSFKNEKIIITPQNAKIKIANNSNISIINMCSNNYLGLANHPEVIEVAQQALSKWGFGTASVRFICGTQDIHKNLENTISNFYNKEDTILFSSCFDANGGLFEVFFDENDAIFSDSLNHASIIDGIRLCKAKRYRYQNNNMEDLKKKLQLDEKSRFKVIVTDGVFSMDGYIAHLDKICEIANEFNALVVVDDCHGTGVLGENGKGTPEYHNVLNKIDLITGTLGKALGGASGGYITGKKEMIDLLRQKARPYLFSNSLAPCLTSASLKIFHLLEKSKNNQKKLMHNTLYYRKNLKKAGFEIKDGIHPIVPIMTKSSELASEFAKKSLKKGIYVVGFSYPVVPKGEARVRTQLSSNHNIEEIQYVIETFTNIGKELNIIN